MGNGVSQPFINFPIWESDRQTEWSNPLYYIIWYNLIYNKRRWFEGVWNVMMTRKNSRFFTSSRHDYDFVTSQGLGPRSSGDAQGGWGEGRRQGNAGGRTLYGGARSRFVQCTKQCARNTTGEQARARAHTKDQKINRSIDQSKSFDDNIKSVLW